MKIRLPIMIFCSFVAISPAHALTCEPINLPHDGLRLVESLTRWKYDFWFVIGMEFTNPLCQSIEQVKVECTIYDKDYRPIAIETDWPFQSIPPRGQRLGEFNITHLAAAAHTYSCKIIGGF